MDFEIFYNIKLATPSCRKDLRMIGLEIARPSNIKKNKIIHSRTLKII